MASSGNITNNLLDVFPEMHGFEGMPPFDDFEGNSADLIQMSSSESDSSEDEEAKNQQKQYADRIRHLLKDNVHTQFESQQDPSIEEEIPSQSQKHLPLETQLQEKSISVRVSPKRYRYDAQAEVHLGGLIDARASKVSKLKGTSKFNLFENSHLDKACGTEDILFYIFNDREVRFINRKEPHYLLISPDFLTHIAFKNKNKGRIGGMTCVAISEEVTYLLIFYAFGAILVYRVSHKRQSQMSFTKKFAINCSSLANDDEAFEYVNTTAAPFIKQAKFSVQVVDKRVFIHESISNKLFCVSLESLEKKKVASHFWCLDWKIDEEYIYFGVPVSSGEVLSLISHGSEMLSSFSLFQRVSSKESTLFFSTAANRCFRYIYEQDTEAGLGSLVESGEICIPTAETVEFTNVVCLSEDVILLFTQDTDSRECQLLVVNIEKKEVVLTIETGLAADVLSSRLAFLLAAKVVFLHIPGTKEGKWYVFDKDCNLKGVAKIPFSSTLQSLSICPHRVSATKIESVTFSKNFIGVLTCDVQSALETKSGIDILSTTPQNRRKQPLQFSKLVVKKTSPPKAIMTKEGTFSIETQASSRSTAADNITPPAKSIPKREKLTISNQDISTKTEKSRAFKKTQESLSLQKELQTGLAKLQDDLKITFQRSLATNVEKAFASSVIPAVNAAFVEMRTQMLENVGKALRKDKAREAESELLKANKKLCTEVESLRNEVLSLSNELKEMRQQMKPSAQSTVPTPGPPLPPHMGPVQEPRQHYSNIHQPPRPYLYGNQRFVPSPPGLDRSFENSLMLNSNGVNNLYHYGDGNLRQQQNLSTQPPQVNNPLQLKRNDSITSTVSSVVGGPIVTVRQHLMQDDFQGAFYVVITQENRALEVRLIGVILKYMENSNKMDTTTLALLPRSTVMKVFQILSADFTTVTSSPSYEDSFDLADFKRRLHFIQNAALAVNKEGLGYYTATVVKDLSQSLDSVFKWLSGFSRITPELSDKFKMAKMLLGSFS